MTISTTNTIAGSFLGNGVATTFPFTDIKVLQKADFQVIHTDASGVETTLTLDVDYSLVLNADQDASPGGTITYPVSGSPLPTGEKLTGVRIVTSTQSMDLANQSKYDAEVVETSADKVVMMIQQLQEELSRAVKVAITSGTDPSALIASISASVAAAAASEAAADADAIATAADVVTTNADVVLADQAVVDAEAAAASAAQLHIGVAAGTANALTAVTVPPMTTLNTGAICSIKALLSNTNTVVTFAPDGLAAKSVNINGGVVPPTGSIAGVGHEILLKYNGTVWELLNPARKFRGALVWNTSNQTLANATSVFLAMDSEEYDTDNIHDTVTNNSRLTVPAGVTRVRLIGKTATFSDTGGANEGIQLSIFKNLTASYVGYPMTGYTYGGGAPYVMVESPVLTVVGGDYFSLVIRQSGGVANSAIGGQAITWFAMEIIE